MADQQKDEQSPLDVITNPDNFVTREQSYGDTEAKEEAKSSCKGMSRRDMLKLGGAAAAVSVAASAAAGFATGRSADGYTGWGRTAQGDDMFFNREPFRVDVCPGMEPVGEVTRPNWTDFLFERTAVMGGLMRSKQWNPSMGVEAIPGEIGDYYRANPERYEAYIDQLDRITKRLEHWNNTAYDQYALSNAYTRAFDSGMNNHAGNAVPEDPEDVFMKTGKPQPPEEWDFRYVNKNRKKMEFKSPAHASKLIKRMAHMFGASIVGICKFDERFMFKNLMRGMPNRGRDSWGDKVPSHWKSAIVFGSPMYWDSTYAAIGYSSSYDGYFKSRCTCALLERFIQELGYGARTQFPGSRYEVMAAPFAMLAGVGEYGRSGMVMVPELGCNFRTALVVTELEFEYDKPIDINMGHFCKKCKICAETCPSGAISFDDEPQTVIRGFKRWLLDEEKCYSAWVSGTTLRGDGCRVCVGVCPYTRKNTWIHKISRELDPRDPTGLFASTLLAMQQNFFKYPAGEEFRATWDGGTEAVYHNPPWWQRTEDFFENVVQTWEYNGMH